MCFLLKPQVNILCDNFNNSFELFMAVQKSVRQFFFQVIYWHGFYRVESSWVQPIESPAYSICQPQFTNCSFLKLKTELTQENCLMFSKVATENILSEQHKFKKNSSKQTKPLSCPG